MNLPKLFNREGHAEVRNATARLEQHARDLQLVIRLARLELERQQRLEGGAGEARR